MNLGTIIIREWILDSLGLKPWPQALASSLGSTSLGTPGLATNMVWLPLVWWGQVGTPPPTVPAISFKMDILAQKVNFMKLKKQAFFNILDTLFEAQYSENLKLLIISA